MENEYAWYLREGDVRYIMKREWREGVVVARRLQGRRVAHFYNEPRCWEKSDLSNFRVPWSELEKDTMNTDFVEYLLEIKSDLEGVKK